MGCVGSPTGSTPTELAKPDVLVGSVEDGEGLIAIVRSDGHLVAYACGFEANLPTHTGWFFGVNTGQQLELVNANNNLRVEGSLEDAGASGTLTLADGRVLNWTAEPARGPLLFRRRHQARRLHPGQQGPDGGQLVEDPLAAVSPWFIGQFGDEADALIGVLNGDVTLTAPSVLVPIHIDQKWTIGFDGSTVEVPIPAWECGGLQVSDGEMDNHGAVHSASALGFTLAREPFFFEHDRLDAPNGQFGSWYRLHQNPDAEKFHHGLQYENSVGVWFFKTFLAAEVGPVAQPDTFSTWAE